MQESEGQTLTLTLRRHTDRSTRLANERDKASHALREWAGAEGPDLNVRFPTPIHVSAAELTFLFLAGRR